MNSAEIIAHAVLGLPVEGLNPASLLIAAASSRRAASTASSRPTSSTGCSRSRGASSSSALARRLGRFDWSAVEQDVLKVLYESVIGAETRKRLGEYYTPDWLAEADGRTR